MNNKALVFLLSFVMASVILILFIGLILDVIILVLKFRRKELIRRTLEAPAVRWTVWDVAKVIILFLFFGYALAFVELVLTPIFPSLKNEETLKSTLNTAILDTLGVFFVLYFVIKQYRQKLIDLGVSFKNFFRNIFYGLIGYIATAPILLLILLATIWVVSVFKYHPPPQPILELFVQEKKITALVILSLFVTIFGPIAEEIFFRGFMYSAIKKELGFLWALLLSSALFAFMHAHVVGFLPIMVLGLLLGYLYEKTGSLVSSVAVHIFHNSLMVFFVFLMKEIYF